MDTQETILAFLARNDYVPTSAEEIQETLGKEITASSFNTALTALRTSGEIVALKNGHLCLPSDANLVVGKIFFRQSGAASIRVPEGPVVEIPAEGTGVALHGDQVVARLMEEKEARRFRKASQDETTKIARVIRVLARARMTMTGTLDRTKLLYHVIPDDPRVVRNIIVGDPKSSTVKPTPKPGDKVVVKLEEWTQRHLNPQGKITAVLGKSHEPLTEHAAVFAQYGLTKEFPAEVEAEATRVGQPVSAEQCVGRLDLRDKAVFTIDPDDAKDFDDALHLEKLPNGNTKIGVHIADVSAYVHPGSSLDREAQRRGNSTYLVGEVVPMLPHALSSGVCSLKEAEDRLTKTCIFTFDPKGDVIDVEYANTVIRSIKRLTYKQAKLIMVTDDLEAIRAVPPPPAHQTGFIGRPLNALTNEELRLLQTSIRQMWTIAQKLRAARMKAGSLDLDMPEAKIYVDAKGYPERIERVEHDESHQLIEEYMLLANEAVARAFNRGHLAAIHRVHDKPDAEKLDDLRETLLAMGIKVGDLSNQREVAKFLEMTRTHPKGVYLKGLFLRSMRQACYKASPDGHFGLAKTDYTHFTSPIRRYADFIVHRIFDAYLFRNAISSAPKIAPPSYNVSALQSIAEHISTTEQNSTEAERQSIKNRLLEYFEIESKRKPKNAFDAVITDIKNHGLFIELSQSMAFGLVHVSMMGDDFYTYNEDEGVMVGRKTQKRFAIGDKIKVIVERVDRFKRQMDFTLSDGVAVAPVAAPAARRVAPKAPRTQVEPVREYIAAEAPMQPAADLHSDRFDKSEPFPRGDAIPAGGYPKRPGRGGGRQQQQRPAAQQGRGQPKAPSGDRPSQPARSGRSHTKAPFEAARGSMAASPGRDRPRSSHGASRHASGRPEGRPQGRPGSTGPTFAERSHAGRSSESRGVGQPPARSERPQAGSSRPSGDGRRPQGGSGRPHGRPNGQSPYKGGRRSGRR